MHVRNGGDADSGGELVLQVVGDVDIATVADLRAAIGLAMAGPGDPIVLDCARLSFIDATGLGALVWFANEAHGASRLAVLRNMSESMQRVMRTTGLDRRFETGMAGAPS
jgi:anti-sigma B factor antagonist